MLRTVTSLDRGLRLDGGGGFNQKSISELLPRLIGDCDVHIRYAGKETNVVEVDTPLDRGLRHIDFLSAVVVKKPQNCYPA